MKLIYGIEDKPKFSKTLVFAFQQMIAIMAATLLVPLLVTSYGLQADAAAALFGAGIGTLVCTWTRNRAFRRAIRPVAVFPLLPSRSLYIPYIYFSLFMSLYG